MRRLPRLALTIGLSFFVAQPLIVGCSSSGSGDGTASDGSDGTESSDGGDGTDASDGSDGSDGADVPDVPPVSGELPSCGDALFVDAIPAGDWVTVDLAPEGGTEAIREAMRAAGDQPDKAIHIRLAPGYYADNLGGEIYVQHLFRTATTPVWVEATDKSAGATELGQGFNFVGVAYVALDGMTIGPAEVGAWDGSAHADPQPLQAAAGVHVAGAAIDGGASGVNGDGSLNAAVYGRFEPSHHIVVRNMTIRNLFGRDDPSGESPVGQDNDGIKFNQAQFVWVIGNTITQTSRHGIDNVGTHDAAFCNNVIARNGQGMGIEAKAGSIRVLFEGNLFYRVRRVALGGENSDAAYYWSEDGAYDYEGKQIVARNNLIVDPRESAFDFAACHDCAAIGNTVLFTADYVPPLTDDGQANGGDAIRVHNSMVLGADEGAGSGCSTWDESQSDYVYIETC